MRCDMLAWGHSVFATTKKGKLLFIDDSHYDDYSSINNVKILVGVDGRFWGYSDDKRVLKEGEKEK